MSNNYEIATYRLQHTISRIIISMQEMKSGMETGGQNGNWLKEQNPDLKNTFSRRFLYGVSRMNLIRK
jgi:hypothetical protein